MNLKNYTSGVPVDKTISRIEQAIARFGASHIAKEYNGSGSVKALQFMLHYEGRNHIVKLPANPQQVYEAMMAEVKKPHHGTKERIREQAERTAWKLMQDWIEVQLSLIAMRQADVLQVFLPYVWDGERTFYEAIKDKGFKLLPEKTT